MSTDEIKTAAAGDEEPTEHQTPAEPAVETDVAAPAAESEEKPPESPFYPKKLDNRINVVARGRGSPTRLGNYVDRARRILRCDEELTVIGFGQAISMACTLVELLKRQKIAEIQSVSTTMDTQPIFRNKRLQWGRPVTAIRFILIRGEHAEYVADYHQRKVIEVFENTDKDQTGQLSVEQVEKLDVGGAFLASEDRLEAAKKFLSECKSDLDLPTFIKYCSKLIDPLLKDKVFKERLTQFGISHQDAGRSRA